MKKNTPNQYGLVSSHAPIVMTMDDGSEVLWLKTPAARNQVADLTTEHRGRDHAALSVAGWVDKLVNEKVFLIRKDGEPQLVFKINRERLSDAVPIADGSDLEDFEPALQEIVVILANRMMIHQYPDVEVRDGWHNTFNGRQIHFRDGYIENDDDEPAVIIDDGYDDVIIEYRKRNELSRNSGPAYIWPAREIEIWVNEGLVFEPTDEQRENWEAQKNATPSLGM